MLKEVNDGNPQTVNYLILPTLPILNFNTINSDKTEQKLNKP